MQTQFNLKHFFPNYAYNVSHRDPGGCEFSL